VPETTPGAGDPTDDPTDSPLDDDAIAAGEGDEAETSEAASTPAAGGVDDWMPGAAEPAAKTTGRSKSATIRDSAAATKTPSQPKKMGRTTAKGTAAKTAPRPGRYTPPIPKETRHSPRWFPFALLGFLVLGLLMIVLNYVHVLPGGTSNGYLIGGIGLIVVGLFMATFYH
jgi:cobalamin biosynthesis Mg chelatase CobN